MHRATLSFIVASIMRVCMGVHGCGMVCGMDKGMCLGANVGVDVGEQAGRAPACLAQSCFYILGLVSDVSVLFLCPLSLSRPLVVVSTGD